MPESGRDKSGFCYNPWDKRCKLLGGSFFIANPEKDLSKSSENINSKVKSLWLWNKKSERELLEDIYHLLKSTSEIVKKAHNGKVSALLCGIGITTSDVPILIDLFKRYKILSNEESFSFQNEFRLIDLSQLSIATFNNSNNFLYPKQKSLLLQKYIPEKKFESGKSVWGMYDEKQYDQIESRVVDEVVCTHECYIKILANVREFKRLEKNHKRQQKLLAKQDEAESLLSK